MIEPSIRYRLPECDRCLFYAHSPFLLCTNHPEGVNAESCPDFQCNPMVEPEELWEPEGGSYYNGELILAPRQRWSLLEKLALLDSHPLFTGRCPNCGTRMPYTDLKIHLDCEQCGWTDDSV